jgi:maltokinase
VAESLWSASYPPVPAVLDELRAAWPPPAASRPEGTPGYVDVDLAEHEPVAALSLTGSLAVALAADGDAFLVVPLTRDSAADGAWRRAAPGDRLSAFVAGAPLASERPVGVDQTHASVVVGERVIVKWFRRVGPKPSRATLLIGHLDAIGYQGIPKPLGTVDWRSPAGETLTLAQGDAYLPSARDGWEWCVEAVEQGTASTIGGDLGRFVADLHAALATPSSLVGEPLATATPADVAGWRGRALATLEDALDLTDGEDGEVLRALEPAMRTILQAMPVDQSVPIQPVHGDLHVGQILSWPGGLAVIDFDGNPTLGDEANDIRQPVERDVAQLLMSLDHVGRIVVKDRGGDPDGAVEAWIATQRRHILAEVGPQDPALLAAFEVEQECRELVYAARFLPRWRYAPIATLRARFGS